MREMQGLTFSCVVGAMCIVGCAEQAPLEEAQAPVEEAQVPADIPADVPGCSEHHQCESDVCDRDALAGHGVCVPEASVVYADSTSTQGCETADGSRGNPVCQIRDAMALLTGGKDTIRVYPGSYRNFGVSGVAVRVFGPGAEAAEVGEEDIGAAVRVTGGAKVLLDGLTFAVSVRNGVACSASTVTLVRSQAFGDLNGVQSIDCTLVIDRTRVGGLTRAGLAITGSGDYRITNSYFRGGDIQAVVLRGSGPGTFAFNTVVGGGETNPGGIDCGTVPRTIQDSIVVGSFGAAQGAQTVGPCAHKRVVVGSLDTRADTGLIHLDPELDAQGRLLDTPANAACCIDRAADSTGVAHDFFGTPRPQGAHSDIGAHELK